MGVDAAILLTLSGTYTKSSGLGEKRWTFKRDGGTSLASGTGAGQADMMYATPDGGYILATGVNLDIDLSGLAAGDVVGDTTAMAKVKVFKLFAYATNVGDLIVGNAANPFVGWFSTGVQTAKVSPSGCMIHLNPVVGWSVFAGTGDIIRINNPTGSDAKFDCEIIGTSV